MPESCDDRRIEDELCVNAERLEVDIGAGLDILGCFGELIRRAEGRPIHLIGVELSRDRRSVVGASGSASRDPAAESLNIPRPE